MDDNNTANNTNPDPVTPDDALTPADDIFTPSVDGPQLPGDYGTPAAPPSDVPADMPADQPATDTGIDSAEIYDAGLDVAANPGAGTVMPETPAGEPETPAGDQPHPLDPAV